MKKLGLVIAAVVLAIVWVSSRGASDAPSPSTPVPAKAPRLAEIAPVDRERAETQVALVAARDLGLDGAETDAVVAAQEELQHGRAQLFANLRAHRIDNTAVSHGLHALRATMHARFEAALGADRAAAMDARIKEAHR